MQHAGARRLREDDDRSPRPARRLHLVEADSVAPAELVAHAEQTARSYEREREAAPRYAENGRRTVTITGSPVPARRRQSVAQTQIQARPDRIALWAFLLGLFLVFMAVATANAAPL